MVRFSVRQQKMLASELLEMCEPGARNLATRKRHSLQLVAILELSQASWYADEEEYYKFIGALTPRLGNWSKMYFDPGTIAYGEISELEDEWVDIVVEVGQANFFVDEVGRRLRFSEIYGAAARLRTQLSPAIARLPPGSAKRARAKLAPLDTATQPTAINLCAIALAHSDAVNLPDNLLGQPKPKPLQRRPTERRTKANNILRRIQNRIVDHLSDAKPKASSSRSLGTGGSVRWTEDGFARISERRARQYEL